MMLSLDTAYRSFGGEVEASSTPTICRLSDSRRHQLWTIAPSRPGDELRRQSQAAFSGHGDASFKSSVGKHLSSKDVSWRDEDWLRLEGSHVTQALDRQLVLIRFTRRPQEA